MRRKDANDLFQLVRKNTKGQTLHVLFSLIDSDGSGRLDFAEFRRGLLHFGIRVSSHKARELILFARSGSQNSDWSLRGKDGLTLDEFLVAVARLQQELSFVAMDKLGFSRRRQLMLIAAAAFGLVVLLTFVGVGIVAYTNTNSFSAAVNSTLTGVSGLAVMKATKIPSKPPKAVDKATKDAVDDAIKDVSETS